MSTYKDLERDTWYVKFRYKNWMGETKWITKRGFQTKRDAQQWERDFILRQSGSLDMTFREFVKVYAEERKPRLKESTWVMKENIIETKLIPYFGNKKLCDISASDVVQWQNELLKFRDQDTGKPYSQVYLKSIHNQLSAIFNHAIRFYKLTGNPARTAGNMGSEKGVEMKFWTKAEYLRFSEVMMDDPFSYFCFEMLYWCGIREGELLALTKEDFNFQTKEVSITKTFQHIKGKDIITDPKTPKSKRKIVMPDFLCEELQDYFRMCYNTNPTDRAFPTTKHSLRRKIILGCKQQGLTLIRVHDLRHSHVSLLIHMGFSAVAIADRMGHESIDITLRYAHLFPSVQTKMANQLDQIHEEDL